MIIVDRALERRQAEGRPVRVAMVGAGFMGRGLALQIVNWVPGMRLVAIANRHIAAARQAYLEAGVPEDMIQEVATAAQLDAAIANGQAAITEDALLVCRAGQVEAVIEVTGTVEAGAHVALTAIEHGKHVILMNAELDGTVGPILKVYADQAGVILTNADGDQPGVSSICTASCAGWASNRCCAAISKACTIRIATPPPRKRLPGAGGSARRWSPRLRTAPRFRSSRRSWPTPPACRWPGAACSAQRFRPAHRSPRP